MNNVVEYTAIRFEMINSEVMKEFMDHIVRVYNSRRQWQLKGHTPNELIKVQKNKSQEIGSSGGVEYVDFVSKKKVGRNDPCPCGSGLKFKRCCLNKY